MLDNGLDICYDMSIRFDKRKEQLTMYEFIGQKIKKRRKELKMSQETLAELSNVSRGTISALENGKCGNVLVGTVAAIANALETTVDKFF